MMKSTIKLLAIIMLLVPAVAMGQSNAAKKMEKKLEKAYLKQTKAQIKKYEKEGWKLDGTTKSIEVALTEHFMRLTDANNREIVGSVRISREEYQRKGKNALQQAALNNAYIKYANEAKTFVKGRVESDVGITGDVVLDNFYSAYERLVASEINGELEHSVSLYVVNKDGTVDYESYFIVNEDNASKKRVKAMENALKESKAAQEWGSKISEFVNQGFQNPE